MKIRRDSVRFTEELKKSLEQVNFVSDYDPVWNLPSRQEALNMARELIINSQKDIYIGVWDDDLEVLKDSLFEAHNKGVKVYVLIYGSAVLDFGEIYYHSTEGIEGVEELGRALWIWL